jgi:hypothetical protein
MKQDRSNTAVTEQSTKKMMDSAAHHQQQQQQSTTTSKEEEPEQLPQILLCCVGKRERHKFKLIYDYYCTKATSTTAPDSFSLRNIRKLLSNNIKTHNHKSVKRYNEFNFCYVVSYDTCYICATDLGFKQKVAFAFLSSLEMDYLLEGGKHVNDVEVSQKVYEFNTIVHNTYSLLEIDQLILTIEQERKELLELKKLCPNSLSVSKDESTPILPVNNTNKRKKRKDTCGSCLII